MSSIVTVTTAASSHNLTTLQRVKAEMSIDGGASDGVLTSKIQEASSDIAAHLGIVLAQETVSETFRPDHADDGDYLKLKRWVPPPLTGVALTVVSVTLDDVDLDASRYELDPANGKLYALSTSGYRCGWYICKSCVVVYTVGYVLPGSQASNLPPVIESACVDLVRSYWFSRGRDPMARQESIPGVMDITYWVGAVGEAGELPPEIVAKLSRFRRIAV